VRRSAGLERILGFAALAFPMAQNAVDDAWVGNQGDDLHQGAAFSDKRVNFKDFIEIVPQFDCGGWLCRAPSLVCSQ